MKKLTVDDIADHRAYEKARGQFPGAHHRYEASPPDLGRRSRHHRVREHRHHALAGPGDGACRADAHRRRDRRSGVDVQRAHPEPGRALGHALHRAHRRRQAPRMAPEAGQHPARGAVRPGRRIARRRRTPRRGTPQSGRRHRDRPLSQVPLYAGAAEHVCCRSGPHRDRPHPVPRDRRAHRRAARRARRATSRSNGCRYASRGLDPELPLRVSSTPTTPDSICTPREDATLERNGGRGLVPTGLAIAIPSGCAGFVLPRSGLALRHGITCLNTPGLIDPLYRGEIKVLLVNTDPTNAYTVAAAIASPSSSSSTSRWSSGSRSASSTSTSRDTFGFGSTGFGTGAAER